jgi:L-arabinose isomerase
MVLGAHMLEVCASIAASKPSLEIHPLGIGGKADPARLVFQVSARPAINASMIDLGERFRLLINEVEAVDPAKALPKLPVARVVWKPKPSLKVAAAAWILAGGAHHTCFSQAVDSRHLQDFAEIAGIETVMIDANTDLPELKNQLKWNQVYYRLFD